MKKTVVAAVSIVCAILTSGCCQYLVRDAGNNKEFQNEVNSAIVSKIDPSNAHVVEIKKAFNELDTEIIVGKYYKAENIADSENQLKTICQSLEIILNSSPQSASEDQVRSISQLATTVTTPCYECLKVYERVRVLQPTELYTRLAVSVLDVTSGPALQATSQLTLAGSDRIAVKEKDFRDVWERVSKWAAAIDGSLPSIETVLLSAGSNKDKAARISAILAQTADNFASASPEERNAVKGLSLVFAQLAVGMNSANFEWYNNVVTNPSYRIAKAVLNGFKAGLTELQIKAMIRYYAIRQRTADKEITKEPAGNGAQQAGGR